MTYSICRAEILSLRTSWALLKSASMICVSLWWTTLSSPRSLSCLFERSCSWALQHRQTDLIKQHYSGSHVEITQPNMQCVLDAFIINSNHLCAIRGLNCTCTSSWILLTDTLHFLVGNHETDNPFLLNYRGGRHDVQLQTKLSWVPKCRARAGVVLKRNGIHSYCVNARFFNYLSAI